MIYVAYVRSKHNCAACTPRTMFADNWTLTVTEIRLERDLLRIRNVVETWPSATGFEFGVGRK